jgi:hypothetical protein
MYEHHWVHHDAVYRETWPFVLIQATIPIPEDNLEFAAMYPEVRGVLAGKLLAWIPTPDQPDPGFCSQILEGVVWPDAAIEPDSDVIFERDYPCQNAPFLAPPDVDEEVVPHSSDEDDSSED